MKKRSLVLVSCIFAITFINMVSAGIYFSDLQSKYNLGDMIDLDVQVDPIVSGRLLKVNLFCNDAHVLEFINFPDESGYVNIKLPLNYFTIDQSNGNCYFIGDYVNDNRKSMDFEISKLLLVRLAGDSFFVNPGEEILVSGLAEKLNGQFVNGEVEISIPLMGLYEVEEAVEEVVEDTEDTEESEETVEDEVVEEETEEEAVEEVEEVEEIQDDVDYTTGVYYGQVVNGDFSVYITLPENTPAGDYRIDVLAFEETDGLRSSEGLAIANLKVFQNLRDIDIALNNQNLDPGTILNIKPELLDQSGNNIDDEVSVIIRDLNGERYFEKIVRSQETINYDIPTNFNFGYYEIEVSSGSIVNVKDIFINEKAIVTFELINDTLIITNVGNIPYNKGVEVELNGKPFIRVVELELGESTSFKLTGPDEEYNVKVTDGNSEINQGGVVLTGRVVDVDSLVASGIGVSGPIGWIFLIIILAVILLYLFRNVLKKKSFAFHFKGFSKKKDVVEISKGVDSKGKDDKNVKNVKGSIVHNKADQVLVMKGHKSSVAVLVLKIKNKIGKSEKQSLEKAIEHVYSKKGAVYEQGDFIFIIFSPLMTKTNKNEVEATKVAQKIIGVLDDHNKKFKEKIDFGIGINSGEIINKVEKGKLKFTALGNFVVAAKRLAESSDRQVLVTKVAFEKGISEIKAKKIKLSEGEVYEVRDVVDNERNRKFIGEFLKRQEK